MESEPIRTQSIVVDLKGVRKSEAIAELLRRARAFDCVEDIDELTESIMLREAKMSTGFGRGVAIAHGETSCVEQVAVALGLSRAGIDFDSMDGKPVHILFIVVNPTGERGEYLDVLATLTSLLRSEELRDKIRGCTMIGEVELMVREALDRYWLARANA